MGDASYGNAMTEIALALAMAFFAIMVLTMVSMGAPVVKSAAKTPAEAERPPIKLVLAPPSPETEANSTPSGANPTIIVFWDGRFFDQDLKPVVVANRTFPGQIILALSPDLSMAEALKARTRIQAPNIVVSTLDARWLDSIRQAIGKE